MITPFSWLDVGIASAPTLMKTVGAMSQSAGQIFGELLATAGPKASGPSAATQEVRNSPSHSGRFEAVVDRLKSWVDQIAKQNGLSLDDNALSVEVTHENDIQVHGIEPMRSWLENHLQSEPQLRGELLEVAKSSDSPLSWLPGATNSGSFRISLLSKGSASVIEAGKA